MSWAGLWIRIHFMLYHQKKVNCEENCSIVKSLIIIFNLITVEGEVWNLVGHVEVGEELSGLDDCAQLFPLFWQGVHT